MRVQIGPVDLMKTALSIFLAVVVTVVTAAPLQEQGQAVLSEREEGCLDLNMSHRHDAPAVRALTLSIGQSAASVSSDPALTDIVAPVPFEKGVVAYVNQPFDLTYKQEGLTFNVPRTHTLWISATAKKLAVIGIEPCPLIENDFGAALGALKQWKARFDGMKLKEVNDHPRFPLNDIEHLDERFKAVDLPRLGQRVGVWRIGNTYLILSLVRVEREYVDPSKNAVQRPAYLYKVSLSLFDVGEIDSQGPE
jgi:hypothetical protein